MTSGGSLSLASLALPGQVMTTAMAGLSGAGSWLALEAVTLEETTFALTGTVTKVDSAIVCDPPGLGGGFGAATFTVLSGPCTLSEGGRCVGRWPNGYGPNEDCAIAVAGGGGGGVLGGCPVFDLGPWDLDYLTLPDGSQHGVADCPAGAVLAAGQSLAWHSDGSYQGHNGGNGLRANPTQGLGGGWQVCFA